MHMIRAEWADSELQGDHGNRHEESHFPRHSPPRVGLEGTARKAANRDIPVIVKERAAVHQGPRLIGVTGVTTHPFVRGWTAAQVVRTSTPAVTTPIPSI